MAELPPDITRRFDDEPDDPEGKPKAVTLIATLGLIIGTCGVVMLPFALFGYLGSPTFPPVYVEGNPLLSWWSIGASIIGTVLSVILLIGSAGALSLRPWGRPVLLAWAGAALLLGVVSSFVYFRWFIPAYRENLTGVRGVGQLSDVFAWVIGTLFAIFVLYHLTRRHVREAFQRFGMYEPEEAEEG